MVESTILFPNFNNEFVLPYTFEYLQRNLDTTKYNIVIVDDGSTDKSVEVCKKQLSRIKFNHSQIIELSHTGIIKALNTGLEAVKTEFVFRIDGDATVETPNWIEKIKKILIQNNRIGLVGGQVIFDHGHVHSFGRNLFNEVGLFDLGTIPLELVGQRTFDSIVYRPKSNFIEQMPYEVDTLLGVCTGFRYEDAKALNGFDELFNPVWIEDDDFGVQIRKLGKKVIVYPEIKIVHRIGLRGSRDPNEKRKNLFNKFSIGSIKGTYIRRIKESNNLLEIPIENNHWRTNILTNHYHNWEKKWGFHPLNPKIEDFLNMYYETELCWKLNPSISSNFKLILD
ncbi:MAG: glycosyltransferase family 2 protein [Bacteroidota bacterium]|nr:glycosyltransferase family 2 protein [Bacteroidota bacterium]